MTWTPITLGELQSLIASDTTDMTATETTLWRRVAIVPEKCARSPWGDEGGGFWVVGVAGANCVYYNDLEDGFNVSAFERWGAIGAYFCNQD